MGGLAGGIPIPDPSAGAGVGVGGGGTSVDPSGFGGGSPDFGQGPFDPSTGMGAGDIGAGSGLGSFAGIIPGDPTGSIGAQQAIQGPQAANQPPLTDQPAPPTPAANQAQAPSQSAIPDWVRRAVDVNHALWHGPESLSATPGGQQVAALAPPRNPFPVAGTDKEDSTDPYHPEGTNIDPSQRPELPPGYPASIFSSSDATTSEAWGRLPNTNLAQDTFKDRFSGAPYTFKDRFPNDQAFTPTPAATPPAAPPPAAPPAATPPSSAPPETDPNTSSDSSAIGGGGPKTTPIVPPSGSTTGTPPVTSPAATPPAATPPAATTPTSSMGGGMGGTGSPLEQLIGGFIHMLLGGQGGIGSMLEQMIDRALGINPQRLLTSPGAAFNPPPPSPGSGYFPAGTTGGRAVAPGGQQTSGAGTGAPPLPRPTPPGPPGSSGNQPLAITPRGAENHPQAPDGTPSPGARQAGSGGQNTTGVPDRVIQLARQWATKGGPAAVYQFMQENGHPRSGAWCGEFAAAVMHSQGLPVPNNPEVASNWRTWGNPTRFPRPGDIAVRNSSYINGRYVPTGATGAHVTTVISADPARGTVTVIGGNQRGGAVSQDVRPMDEFDFRTLNPSNENMAQARPDQPIRPQSQQQPQRPQQPRRPSGMTAAQRRILTRRRQHRHRIASEDMMEA